MTASGYSSGEALFDGVSTSLEGAPGDEASGGGASGGGASGGGASGGGASSGGASGTAQVTTATGRIHVIDDGAPVLSAEEFKAAFRNHPAGVAVITADAGDGPVALTATSVFSVSAEPPLLVFSLSATSSSTPTLINADTVVVHLLTSAQLDIAVLGATSGVDRFADTSIWSRLETGEPYFTAAPVWIRGKVVDRMEAGASTVLAVEALEARTPERGSPEADANQSHPLVYHNRTWHVLSEASKLQ